MEWISQCQTELVQQGRELFIVDNSDDDWKAVRYVRDWCQISKSIDIATGYFDIGSLLSLGDEWQKVDKIRILMGEEASLRTKKAFQEGLSTATNRFDNSLEDEKGRNIFLMTGGCSPLSYRTITYFIVLYKSSPPTWNLPSVAFGLTQANCTGRRCYFSVPRKRLFRV